MMNNENWSYGKCFKFNYEEKSYAVLRTSACSPYSLAKMKDVMDCGKAACKTNYQIMSTAKTGDIQLSSRN